ncbi:SDR family oxidoreductase [Devosia submarina]|uniref:SDR family oxidoreductase n=1 Tax=Devosia submarina TaxID=1173082 RepID=UPI000D381E38|nr:SDR family oxidoreductase [Devosia submarina]
MDRGVVVVTGGSRGIGAAIALLAAERGYGVVVNYAASRDAAEAVCGQITSKGGSAIAVKANVAVEADIEQLFVEADAFGPLAGLVNNAGVVDKAARVDEMDMARLTRMFSINTLGSILCAGQAVRRMSTRHGGKGGAIVNIGSAASKLGAPAMFVDYAAAKGAIDTFTIGLALEVANEGIRVNAVRPGIIETDIHASGGDPERAARLAPSLPMARTGTAEEVARAALWLLSDEASYTTGTVIHVSGGRAIAP